MSNTDLMETNDLSKNANGGTEQMLKRIYNSLPRDLLEKVQIVPSRLREIKTDKFRFYYCHDLPGDPEAANALQDEGWHRFHRIVFVSNWQAQRFIDLYNIPWSKVVVMLNAITPVKLPEEKKNGDVVRLVYHTTPHRGLNILLPVFEKLAEIHNIELDLYSSFKLYGWNDRDDEYKELFEVADRHPKINNHGAVPNEKIHEALAKADIFAYPSTWPETSCLCLMEAMSAGLNCVHPNFGALYETAAGWTSMYHYHEDLNEHAKLFAGMLDGAIKNVSNVNMQGRLQSQKVYADAFYNWTSRAKQWEALLNSVVQSGETLDAVKPEKEFVYQV